MRARCMLSEKKKKKKKKKRKKTTFGSIFYKSWSTFYKT